MFKINADRPALEVERGGVKTKWEYDVVALKIELERLESVAGKEISRELLQAFAAVLVANGLEGCTLDLALRVRALIIVQFNQLSFSITDQLRAV